MIYFDYAASSPVNSEVLKTFVKLNQETFANPSSNHDLGYQALALENKAKSQILKRLGLDESQYELIFTSGASESNNFLIEGIAKRNIKYGQRIITTKVEHPSVLEVFKRLETEGFDVIYLNVDKNGNLDLAQLRQVLNDKTTLVSIMGTNNEVGFNFPLEEISKLIKSKSHAYFISDLTQSFGKINVNFNALDGLCFSGHKIEGLKSSGLAIFKKSLKIEPLIVGGTQQDSYRAGTINAPLNCSLATAIRVYLSSFDKRLENVKKLYNYIYSALLTKKDDIQVISNLTNTSYYILSFCLKRHKASVLVEALSKNGIYVSTKSACSEKHLSYSEVIYEMGYSKELASNSIRLSFSALADVKVGEEFIKILFELLEQIARKDYE